MPTRKAIAKLKRDLIIMGEMCENAVSTAIMALVDRNEEMAQQAIDYDREIDEMELAVDADCVRLLEEGALAGENLRFVAAAIKINNDLERVGDQTVEVCEHVLFLVQQQSVLWGLADFPALVEQISQIIQEGIRSLVEVDVDLAWKIIDEHLVVHDEVALIFSEVIQTMHESPRAIERCCHILAVTKALDRIADLATNIAEEVVYMVDAKMVRHHIREFHPVKTPLTAARSDAPETMEEHESSLVKRHTRRLQKRRGQRAQSAQA